MSSHFLQSREWEEFQKSLGREAFRVDGVLFVKVPLAFGKNYLYCAGASSFQPAADPPLAEKSQKLFENFAKQRNAVFLKLEPLTEYSESENNLLKLGFVKSKKEIQPQRTIVLDLTKSEEELLRGMHEKTRYNIRLASRMPNVKFQISNAVDSFWELVRKTARRDKFSTHTKEYYEKLLELPTTQLFTAEYRGKIVAANIILFYGDTAHYLHGASGYEYRNFMAPYLLHWETIKYAKEHGYKKYDLWGVDVTKWPGVTRFKKGFGGKEVGYIGSHDYVFEPFWYMLYTLRSFIKRTF